MQVSGWDLHCRRLVHTLLCMSSAAAGGTHEVLLKHLSAGQSAIEALLGLSMRAAASGASASTDGCAAWKVVILLFFRPVQGVTSVACASNRAKPGLCAAFRQLLLSGITFAGCSGALQDILGAAVHITPLATAARPPVSQARPALYRMQRILSGPRSVRP